MEFIRLGKNWLVKDSNGLVISDTQKKQFEKNLQNPNHEPCDCNKETKKNKKHFKSVEVHNGIIEETKSIKE